MRKIVFDIETKNTFQDAGSSNPEKLDLSIVCIYDYERDVYESFLETELQKLWPTIEKADMLIGFNSDHFDIPLLNKYYPGKLSIIKSLDILEEVRKSLGRRVSLGQIAEATLGYGKGGNGLKAIQWWKEGDIESLRTYCIEDVKITREIYDYAKKHGQVLYADHGKKSTIPLDTSGWETAKDSSMTFSLPF